MDHTHIAIRSYPLTSVNTFTVATASSHTNRYCFILVLKMSSVIELCIHTGSIFQVCNPKYVADLKKKQSVFGVANGKTGALCKRVLFTGTIGTKYPLLIFL